MTDDRAVVGETIFHVLKRVKPMDEWVLFYGDGTVARSTQVSWEDCPDDNVQFLLTYHMAPRGHRLYCTGFTGDDEYRIPGSDHVKYGKTIPDEEYDRISKRAAAEPTPGHTKFVPDQDGNPTRSGCCD